MRMLSLTLVLLGLVSCVFAETCPSHEDLYPCTCDEDETGDILVTCSDETLTQGTLKTSLNGLSGKQDVDLALSDFELGKVPSNFFYGIGIKRLDISHCDLDSLSDGGQPALLGLETTLEELSIVSSFTEENVPAKLKIGHLRRLKELDLSYNIITQLGDDWFEGGPVSLEFLTLSNNGIEQIGSKAFANLVNLKELSVDGNRFGPIRRSIFPNPAQRLEQLELDNNALTDIPEDMFNGMPALSSVSFRTNGILRLDERTWQPIWQQLNLVSLQGNPIQCDEHMNWIFRLKAPTIYGTCRTPKEFEGRSLQDFIDSRS